MMVVSTPRMVGKSLLEKRFLEACKPGAIIETDHARDAMPYLYSQGLQKSFFQDGLIMAGTISADKLRCDQMAFPFPGDKPCRYCGRKKGESKGATCAGCGAPL